MTGFTGEFSFVNEELFILYMRPYTRNIANWGNVAGCRRMMI